MAKKTTNALSDLVPAGFARPGQSVDLSAKSLTVALNAVGEMELSLDEAQSIIRLILESARVLGHQIPEGFAFTLGQVFYEKGRIEEVRLAGIGTNKDAPPNSPVIAWRTPMPPKIEVINKRIILNEADKERLHLTACVVAGEGKEGHERRVSVLFDLRGNSTSVKTNSPENLTSGFPSTSIAHASNFQEDRDLHRGLMLKDKDGIWFTNENAGTKFYNGAKTTVTFRPPEMFAPAWEDAREATLKQLDRRFREMRSELTADIIDILFHHWYVNRKPQKNNKAAITLTDICKYRNKEVQQKTLVSHWQAMRDARSIRLAGAGVDAALFEIDSFDADGAKSEQLTLSLWNADTPPSSDVIYFYSPGFFLSMAVEDNPLYIARYMGKIWELDPYRNSIAKRLARYLRGEWRMNTQAYLRPKDATPTRWRTWDKILHDAGVDVQEYLNSKNPSRLRTEVETGLSTLYDIETIANCGKEIYHPDEQIWLENLPRKGMIKHWLELRVCIDPAADTCDVLATANEKRNALITQRQTSEEKGKQKGRKKSHI